MDKKKILSALSSGLTVLAVVLIIYVFYNVFRLKNEVPPGTCVMAMYRRPTYMAIGALLISIAVDWLNKED